jgi:hypothetical protein
MTDMSHPAMRIAGVQGGQPHERPMDGPGRLRNIDVTSFAMQEGDRALLEGLMAVEGLHSSEVLRRALRAYAAARGAQAQAAS